MVQHVLLSLCEDRGGEDKVFLQTVDERGGKLLVDSVLLCYHNQPGGREGERAVRGMMCESRRKELGQCERWMRGRDMTHLKLS